MLVVEQRMRLECRDWNVEIDEQREKPQENVTVVHNQPHCGTIEIVTREQIIHRFMAMTMSLAVRIPVWGSVLVESR